MFETSVIRAEVVGERRFGLMSASFAFHGLVVISILAAGIRTVEFPTRAPNEFDLLRVAAPLPIPPALGVPNGGHKQAAAPATEKQKTVVPTAITAPRTVPDHVELTAATTTGETSTNADSAGSDQPKGVPWGTKDGIGDGPPGVASVAQAEPDVPLPVGGDVKPPIVIHRVTPAYPRTAIAMHLSGFAIVECIIDKTGHVREAHLVRSSSSLFDQSAVDAVLQWQFAPGSLHGKSVDTIFDLTVTFRLSS